MHSAHILEKHLFFVSMMFVILPALVYVEFRETFPMFSFFNSPPCYSTPSCIGTRETSSEHVEVGQQSAVQNGQLSFLILTRISYSLGH